MIGQMTPPPPPAPMNLNERFSSEAFIVFHPSSGLLGLHYSDRVRVLESGVLHACETFRKGWLPGKEEGGTDLPVLPLRLGGRAHGSYLWTAKGVL